MIITIIMIYNRGDDLHKMNFSLDFTTTTKLVMHFDWKNNKKNYKIFIRNKWGNK
jgi:hypothetical protein